MEHVVARRAARGHQSTANHRRATTASHQVTKSPSHQVTESPRLDGSAPVCSNDPGIAGRHPPRETRTIPRTYLAFMPSKVGNEGNVRRRVPVVPTTPTATSTAPEPTSSTAPVRSTGSVPSRVAVPSSKCLIGTPSTTSTTSTPSTAALPRIHRDHGPTCMPACRPEGARGVAKICSCVPPLEGDELFPPRLRTTKSRIFPVFDPIRPYQCRDSVHRSGTRRPRGDALGQSVANFAWAQSFVPACSRVLVFFGVGGRIEIHKLIYGGSLDHACGFPWRWAVGGFGPGGEVPAPESACVGLRQVVGRGVESSAGGLGRLPWLE